MSNRLCERSAAIQQLIQWGNTQVKSFLIDNPPLDLFWIAAQGRNDVFA
jgi:hypothetical protein